MTRALLLGFVLVTAACGTASFESSCAGQVPPPAACNTPCDPSPGASSSCAAGYHCSADGKCDTLCTPTGNQCGNGYACTGDGFCVGNGGSNDPIVDSNCSSVHFTATPTPSIQLLIDRSASMLANFDGQGPNRDHSNGPYKYTTVQDALVGPQGIVTQLEDKIYFGASMFPSDVCPGVYQSPRAKATKATIDAFLQVHAPTNGNTPTPQAIDAAIADFMANPPPAGSPRVIVLATDGLPNDCNAGGDAAAAQTATINAARAAFAHDIRLYLLVVGNQIDDTFKQALADAGQGTHDAKAYTALNPTDLADAFQTIIRGIVSCDLAIRGGSVDATTAGSGMVALNGATLTYGTDWTLDPSGAVLHIIGAACETLKSSPNPVVDASFDCGTVIL